MVVRFRFMFGVQRRMLTYITNVCTYYTLSNLRHVSSKQNNINTWLYVGLESWSPTGYSPVFDTSNHPNHLPTRTFLGLYTHAVDGRLQKDAKRVTTATYRSKGPLTRLPYLTSWEWERAGWKVSIANFTSCHTGVFKSVDTEVFTFPFSSVLVSSNSLSSWGSKYMLLYLLNAPVCLPESY